MMNSLQGATQAVPGCRSMAALIVASVILGVLCLSPALSEAAFQKSVVERRAVPTPVLKTMRTPNLTRLTRQVTRPTIRAVRSRSFVMPRPRIQLPMLQSTRIFGPRVFLTRTALRAPMLMRTRFVLTGPGAPKQE